MRKAHLELAHEYWRRHLQPDDTAIDATCGNGKDLAYLATLLPEGKIFALDIQLEALDAARKNAPNSIIFLHQCHSVLPEDPDLRLIVYNLGYLPGGNKAITTRTQTTLQSAKLGLERLKTGGALSFVCYPHEEGKREREVLLEWTKEAPVEAKHHVFGAHAPSFLWVIKSQT
ncbi:MAG: methyltransferase domain-containing protein [Verrucomicrobia bacterium]|nr:methyltransferase domain-containing protein [Verrucomicrobiota bacterium]